MLITHSILANFITSLPTVSWEPFKHYTHYPVRLSCTAITSLSDQVGAAMRQTLGVSGIITMDVVFWHKNLSDIESQPWSSFIHDSMQLNPSPKSLIFCNPLKQSPAFHQNMYQILHHLLQDQNPLICHFNLLADQIIISPIWTSYIISCPWDMSSIFI